MQMVMPNQMECLWNENETIEKKILFEKKKSTVLTMQDKLIEMRPLIGLNWKIWKTIK